MRRYNIKNFATCVAAIIILYAIFCNCLYKYEMDGIIKNTKPEEVWNYVADFNNMKFLNPTILDFKILSQSGNIHDWRYTVQYTERLSHWPYSHNIGIGHYVVKKSMPHIQPQTFSIQSLHQTCFFKGLYCLETESEFDFVGEADDTHLYERLTYDCPLFLGSVCKREVAYQRKAIMHNLTTIFHDNWRKTDTQ